MPVRFVSSIGIMSKMRRHSQQQYRWPLLKIIQGKEKSQQKRKGVRPQTLDQVSYCLTPPEIWLPIKKSISKRKNSEIYKKSRSQFRSFLGPFMRNYENSCVLRCSHRFLHMLLCGLSQMPKLFSIIQSLMQTCNKSIDLSRTKIVQRLKPVSSPSSPATEYVIFDVQTSVLGIDVRIKMIYDTDFPVQVTLVATIAGSEYKYVVDLGSWVCIPIGIPDVLDIQICFQKWEVKDDYFAFDISLQACVVFCFEIWSYRVTVPLSLLKKDKAQFKRFLALQKEAQKRQLMPRL